LNAHFGYTPQYNEWIKTRKQILIGLGIVAIIVGIIGSTITPFLLIISFIGLLTLVLQNIVLKFGNPSIET